MTEQPITFEPTNKNIGMAGGCGGAQRPPQGKIYHIVSMDK